MLNKTKSKLWAYIHEDGRVVIDGAYGLEYYNLMFDGDAVCLMPVPEFPFIKVSLFNGFDKMRFNSLTIPSSIEGNEGMRVYIIEITQELTLYMIKGDDGVFYEFASAKGFDDRCETVIKYLNECLKAIREE